jgi:tetratricopeptide (TPR) repeat protein
MNGKARYAVFLLLIAMAFVCEACGKDNGRERAAQFIKAGMYEEAIPVLKMYIESKPTDPEAHLLLAKAYLGIEEARLADEEFQRARLLDPGIGDKIGATYYSVAEAALSRSEKRSISSAMYLLDAAVKCDPSLADDAARALNEKGTALASDDASLAHDLLTMAVRFDPELAKNEDIAYRLAMTTMGNDERKSSLEAYVAAFPKGKGTPAAVLELSRCHYREGDLTRAETRLQYVLTEFPDTPEAAEAGQMATDIKTEREEAQRIESERETQVAAAQRQEEQIRKNSALEQARIEADAEKARLEADLKRKERAEQAKLEAKRRQLELKSTARSDFDGADVDGWTPYRAAFANPGSGGSGGGTGNGYLVVTEDVSNTGYFVAPAIYHGDWRGAAELQMDLMSSGGKYFSSGYGMVGDVAIYNGGRCAWRLLPTRPPGSWQRFVVPFVNDGKWKFMGGATNLDDVLMNVTDFRIRAEYGVGADECGLDNVQIIWRD